ncbi:MAG: TonB-dependent receptor [Novosphingobium sp.]|nr:TonB-dependent receptor [Novosphingobium sp.]MCP5401565.1 TonB-dependent receptor [Novosphingobium sp.]
MVRKDSIRIQVLACTALTALALSSVPALAQANEEDSGLGVIVVTAQKREQSVQDVPIAVTAISGESLEVNRVTDVTDLSGLAPGVTVRVSAGGSQLPSFSIRGAISYGVVPGSDKQVSMYLDGVYISSPRGGIFDLPDVQRIEVLRGPQGTLFGRNATAGAVSISTRDPSGEMGFKGRVSVGNRDRLRTTFSLDLPQIGPFSGYVSYMHDEKRGDIRNLGAGQTWDRTASLWGPARSVKTSPEWLGSKNSESVFAAVKFTSGDFTTVYKFDWNKNDGTPDGTAILGYNPNIPLLGTFLTSLIDSQPIPVPFAANGKRPKSVLNSWAIPTTQETQGHSLTSTFQVSDDLSVKNVFAFRKNKLFTASSIDGLSALTFTPQSLGDYATFVAFSTGLLTGTEPLPVIQATIGAVAQGLAPTLGGPFIGIATQPSNRSEQISDELQVNYDSDFLTATVGAVWFQSKDWTGETYFQNTISFAPIPGGVIGNTRSGSTFNKATSIAAYAQLEFHLTPQLDLVLGGRITRDKKSGDFIFGPTLNSLQTLSFTYRKTKPNYLIGLNYKPTEDILLYAKYSTAFVSGGSVAGIPFAPETAKSWEAGVKAEMFDRKVRANLALYHAEYKNYQTAQSSANFVDQITEITGDPTRAGSIGTFVVPLGGVKAKGFEFDIAAAPAQGLSLGGSLSYTDTSFNNLNPVIVAANAGSYGTASYRPKWNGGLWAQYDTQPLVGDAFVTFRADGIWQSDMGLAQNANAPLPLLVPALIEQPSYWLVNGRIALRDLEIGGAKTEFALWAKNLTDEKAIGFALNLNQIFGSANFIPARSYGIDLTIEF